MALQGCSSGGESCRGALTSTVEAEGRTGTLQKVWERCLAQADFLLNLLLCLTQTAKPYQPRFFRLKL